MGVMGLEDLKLTKLAFRRLGKRKAMAYVSLRTYDVTPEVKKLPPTKRHAYLAVRVDRWVNGLRRRYPGLSLQARWGKLSSDGVRRWSELPHSLKTRGPAREILAVASAPGVSSVYVARVEGYRRRRAQRSTLDWYCVRALVVIRVELARSGLQHTEDRFVLVRASSFENAKKRLKQMWRDYATPYLNSNGQMVSWSLDKVTDVYEICEGEIDPAGTEVYSKLGRRRMRSNYVWRPESKSHR